MASDTAAVMAAGFVYLLGELAWAYPRSRMVCCRRTSDSVCSLTGGHQDDHLCADPLDRAPAVCGRLWGAAAPMLMPLAAAALLPVWSPLRLLAPSRSLHRCSFT